MGKPGGQSDVSCPYLGNVIVNKKERICQGLKMCEFVSSEFQEMKHESVDPDSDLCLRMNKDLTNDNLENNTFA